MGDESTACASLELNMDTSSNKDGGNEEESNEIDLVGTDTPSIKKDGNENDVVLVGTSNKDASNEIDAVGTSNRDEQIEEPKPGMMFISEKEVHLYYTNYARKKGFSVMRRTSKPGLDGKVKYFTLACARGGKNRNTAKNPFSRKTSTKTECNAKIRAALCPNGSFILTTVKVEHNHALSLENLQPIRSCRKNLFPYAKRRPESREQVRAIVSKVRAGPLRLEVGDAEAICNYFARMKCNNSGFFDIVDIDDKCRIRNLFWADGRSRAAYEAFGDVVTFDTTYLWERYDLPLATFTGVNHHGQQMLLGCALLSNEDTSTFVWLFESWLDCMSRCPPKAIITARGKEIQAAVERVFPNARHRWCLWSIMKRLSEKMSLDSQSESIKMAFEDAIYDSCSLSEFEEGWRKIIDKHDLHSNRWLGELYDEKHRWAPVCIKECFWAGMSIANPDESMLPFFDGYIEFSTTLKQFIEQYDYILRCKIEKENLEDYNSSNLRCECITHYDIEKQFQVAYTNTKFKEFQDELKGKIYCYPSLLEEKGLISTYRVAEDVKTCNGWKDLFWNVYLNQEEFEVHCTCRLFEFRGILCRHALAVLTQRKVREVPDKYVMSRWRKGFKRKHNFVKSSYEDLSSRPEIQQYDKMCKEFSKIASMAVESDEKCDIVTSFINELRGKVLNHERLPISQTAYDASCAFPNCVLGLNGVLRENGASTNSSALMSTRRTTTKRKASNINQGVRT